LGSMFSAGGNLDISAADCPSTANEPSNDDAGGPISGGDYLLVTGYNASSAATDPLIYDNTGNHNGGVNVGFLAGNVRFEPGGAPTPNTSGTSTTPT